MYKSCSTHREKAPKYSTSQMTLLKLLYTSRRMSASMSRRCSASVMRMYRRIRFVLFFCNEFLFVLIFLIVLRYAGCVFPTRCFMREGNVRRSSRRCTAFFLDSSVLPFWLRNAHGDGRIFPSERKNRAGFPPIRAARTRHPNVPKSCACGTFLILPAVFGRSSHIPRLFLLLVSVPSRLVFSEIAAPATFFILRRASLRHLKR